MRLLFFVVLILSTVGCTQKLEISGEGDIVSSSDTRNCSFEEQPCSYLVAGAYNETYIAAPRPGYSFAGWDGPACDTGNCSYNFNAKAVRKFWGKSFTLKANFVPGNDSSSYANISGKITYDRVGRGDFSRGLDYSNISVAPARRIHVEARSASGRLLDSTTTDLEGNYLIPYAESGQAIRIRAIARIDSPPGSLGSVELRDNTASDAIYVASGALLVTPDSPSTRNLHIPSGWNESTSSYSTTRAAAPFAILDSIYTGMVKVAAEQPSSDFGSLDVFWSIENTTVSGDRTIGQIGTSFYQNKEIYVLGDANNDTDEYDEHVLLHEWGHYFEDTFSRSDSVGGPHGGGDRLDMRLAFGEGLGNALAAIMLDDSIYQDSLGPFQAFGFGFDIQSNNNTNPGWYSEGSVQSIIFDLYDDDADDSVNLGFGPIFTALTTTQVTTDALTSIFPFMSTIKANNASANTAIDQLLSNQQINSSINAFGSNETNDAGNANTLPIYSALSIGSTVNRCVINTFNNGDDRNKLSNSRFFTITPASAGLHQITAIRTSGASSDPDMFLFKQGVFTALGASATIDSETMTVNLSSGTYILQLVDYNLGNNICFNVSANAL
jgi:hypothetical protein